MSSNRNNTVEKLECLNKDNLNKSRFELDYFNLNVHLLGDNKDSKVIQDIKSANSKKKVEEVIKSLADILVTTNLIDINNAPYKSIQLPAPNMISESISHIYNNNELPVEQLVAQGITSMLPSGLSDLVNYAKEQLSRNAMFLDPKLVNVYDKTEPRKFDLQFILMPQNSKEAQDYIDIITCLKKISKPVENKILSLLPILEQDVVVSFDLGGKHNENNFINKLLLSDERNTSGFFLAEVNSDIQSRGKSLMFKDGMPKMITLNLTLIERKPVYYKFWEGHTEWK